MFFVSYCRPNKLNNKISISSHTSAPYLCTIVDTHQNIKQVTLFHPRLFLIEMWQLTKAIATSVLMSLSQLAGVGNFCFNLPLPIFLTLCILSSQAISFQILHYAPFPQIPWLAILSFASYFKLHNFKYLGVNVLTDDITIPPDTT